MSDRPAWMARTRLLLDDEQLNRLRASHILIAGLGGVGSYAAEILGRAGIGKFTLIEGDTVDETNINRQLLALHSTVGQSKVQLMKERIGDINPAAEIITLERFAEPSEFEQILMENRFSYVVDAIDSLTPKLYLIAASLKAKVPLISAMGSGGKTDPDKIGVADISETYNDYFARMIRKRLKKMGISTGFKTVFSTELQNKSSLDYTEGTPYKNSYYGTVSYMPALFGIRMAAEVIRDLTGNNV